MLPEREGGIRVQFSGTGEREMWEEETCHGRDIQEERGGRQCRKIRTRREREGGDSDAQLIERERENDAGKEEERKCPCNYCGCQKEANRMALGTAGLCSTQLVKEGENGL